MYSCIYNQAYMYKHATERKIVYISLTLCVLMYCVGCCMLVWIC